MCPADDPQSAEEGAADAAVAAAVLRSAVDLQHEIASAGLDRDAVMRRVVEHTRTLTGARGVHVAMLDGDELVIAATSAPHDTLLPPRFPATGNLTAIAVATRRSVLVGDIRSDERADPRMQKRLRNRSLIAVPLLQAGETIGVLIVSDREPHAFSQRDVANVELLSLVLVAALSHASQLEAQRDQLAAYTRMSRIVETQRDIAAAGADLGAVMGLIVERIMTLTKAEGAMVSLIEGDDLVVGAAAGIAAGAVGTRRPISSSIIGHAVAARGTLLIERVEDDPRMNRAMRSAIGDRSHVCVPLFEGDRAVAALNVMSRSEEDRLGEDDRRTLELLAVVLAAAVSRAAESQARRRQVEALARFEATFAGALTGMLLLDLQGRILDANRAAQELLGRDGEALVGQQVGEYVHEEDLPQVIEEYASAGEDVDSLRWEHRIVRADGEIRWIDASLSFVRDVDGDRSFSVAMMQDVTQRKAAEAALVAQAELNQYQALHDALTGLANRSLFRDRIEQAVKTARRTGGRVAVLLMDLDRFKEINDSLGHAAGDELLVELGGRLERVLRASDTVARLGGDEFGVLLPDAAASDDVLGAVERIRAAIEEPVIVEGLPLSLEASVGISVFPDDGDDVETLLQHADVAMYHAKEENAGHAFYEASVAQHDPARLTLVGELRRAIEQRELELYYQPKAVLADGEVRSVEALLRWRHPVRGLVPPDAFIPLAQQTGLVRPLTLYVVDEALRQAHAWQREAGLRLAVAVNLSPRNLLDVHFPAEVQALLDRWSVDASLLEFEITESTMLVDPVRTKQILERLSEMGIRLSIDDFGTGYSSLSYLKRLPVNEIKIDRSFVMNMDSSVDDATIVRSTIDLGRNLGLEVVAEGVETEAIWNQLGALGCTVAQGYYLSRPVPASELLAWLDERRRALAEGDGELPHAA